MRTKNIFGYFGGGMKIGKAVDSPMKVDTVLNRYWKIEFLSTFYKVANKVANQDLLVIE